MNFMRDILDYERTAVSEDEIFLSIEDNGEGDKDVVDINCPCWPCGKLNSGGNFCTVILHRMARHTEVGARLATVNKVYDCGCAMILDV